MNLQEQSQAAESLAGCARARRAGAGETAVATQLISCLAAVCPHLV